MIINSDLFIRYMFLVFREFHILEREWFDSLSLLGLIYKIGIVDVAIII